MRQALGVPMVSGFRGTKQDAIELIRQWVIDHKGELQNRQEQKQRPRLKVRVDSGEGRVTFDRRPGRRLAVGFSQLKAPLLAERGLPLSREDGRISQIDSGAWETLNQITETISTGVTYDVEVIVRGTEVALVADGEHKVATSLGAPISGSVRPRTGRGIAARSRVQQRRKLAIRVTQADQRLM